MTVTNEEFFTNQYKQSKLNTDQYNEEPLSGLSYEMGRKHREVKSKYEKVLKGPVVYNDVLKSEHQWL